MPYWLLVAGVIVTKPLVYKKIKLGQRQYDGKLLYVVLWGIVLIALCGLRSIDIGNDTHAYAWEFHTCKISPSFKQWLSSYTYHEYAYYFVMFLVSRILDYQGFLMVMAIISIGPVLYVIYRYSKDITMSMILYICFNYYTMCMSEMRQAAAIGVCMLAYCFAKEKKVIPYLVLCAIAMFFHSSALIFLPVYWISKIPNNKVTRTVAVVGIVAGYVFKDRIWSIATLLARQQYSSNDAGGTLMYLFMLLSIVLGYWYKRNLVDTEEQDSFKELFYLQILAAMLWPMASFNSATARIYYYYHLLFVLYVPVIKQSIGNRLERCIVSTGYYLVAFYFMYSQILIPFRHVYPYIFFWQK